VIEGLFMPPEARAQIAADGPTRRRRARRESVILLVAVAFGAAAPASAGDGEKALARAHYEAATKHYDLREYEDAVKEYKAAYFAKTDPVFLFNIGQCYKKLGQSAQAVEFFRAFLRKAAPGDPNRVTAEGRISELESDAAPLPETTSKAPMQAQPARLAAASDATARPGFSVTESVAGNAGPPAPATALMAGLQPLSNQREGTDLAARDGREASSPDAPFYRTWWFWTGVGTAVVAGAATAIVLGTRGSEPNSATPGLGTRGVFQ